MKRNIAVLCGLLIVAGSLGPLSAKGLTTRIRITGPTLAAPVDITEPEILKRFNVWAGPGTFENDIEATHGFIVDWATGVVADPPAGLAAYDVSFYVKYANRPASDQEDRLAYVVRYEVGPAGEGYVYLPGRSDEHYRLNVNTIHRGREGHWFRAKPEWQRVAGQGIASRQD